MSTKKSSGLVQNKVSRNRGERHTFSVFMFDSTKMTIEAEYMKYWIKREDFYFIFFSFGSYNYRCERVLLLFSLFYRLPLWARSAAPASNRRINNRDRAFSFYTRLIFKWTTRPTGVNERAAAILWACTAELKKQHFLLFITSPDTSHLAFRKLCIYDVFCKEARGGVILKA